jgi:hypothetical protein
VGAGRGALAAGNVTGSAAVLRTCADGPAAARKALRAVFFGTHSTPLRPGSGFLRRSAKQDRWERLDGIVALAPEPRPSAAEAGFFLHGYGTAEAVPFQSGARASHRRDLLRGAAQQGGPCRGLSAPIRLCSGQALRSCADTRPGPEGLLLGRFVPRPEGRGFLRRPAAQDHWHTRDIGGSFMNTGRLRVTYSRLR